MTPRAQLCPDEVLAIRKLYRAGVPIKVIAYRKQRHPHTISNIVNRRSWAHVV